MPLQADRVVRSRLQFLADTDQLDDARAAMDALEASMKRTEQQAAQLRKVRSTFIQIARAGRLIVTAGAGITAALTAPAVAYARSVGKLEATSIKWLRAQERLKDATVSLGRETAAALLPQMERLIALSEKAAQFAQRHPKLVASAASIASIATAVGGLTIVMGEAARIATFMAESATKAIGAINRMVGASKVLQTLGLAGGGGAGGLLGGVSTGALGGIAALTAALGLLTLHIIGLKRGYERPIQGAAQDAGRAGGQLAFLFVVDLLDKFRQIADAIDVLKIAFTGLRAVVLRLITSLGEVVEGFANSAFARTYAGIGPRKAGEIDELEQLGFQMQQVGLSAEEFNDILDGLDATLASELNTNAEKFAERVKNVGQAMGQLQPDPLEPQDDSPFTTGQLDDFERFIQQSEQMEAEYWSNRAMRQVEFRKQMGLLEDEYQRSRLQAIQDFNKQARRAEEDQRRSMIRLQEAFRDRIVDIVENYNEQEASIASDYRRNELERVQDFQRTRERNLEEHLLRLKDAAGQLDAVAVLNEMQRFALSEKQAKEDFQRDSQRREEEYLRERAERRAAFAKQLADAKEQYRRQIEDANEQFQLQRERAREDFEERMRQMADNHRRMMIRRAADFNQEIRQADEAFRARMIQRDNQFAAEFSRMVQHNQWTEEALAAHYATLRNQLIGFIESSGGVAPPRPGETWYEIDPPGSYNPQKSKDGAGVTLNPYTGQPFNPFGTSFHQGGRVPFTGPALLERNEEVLTARVAASIRQAMGGSIDQNTLAGLVGRTVNAGGVNVFGAGGTPEQMESAVMSALARVLEMIV